MEDILSNLEKDKSEWAQDILSKLSKFSPRSLNLTHRQITMAKDLDLSENLKIDYRLAVDSCELDNDFIEGVRALLVDKDNAPRWDPPTLESVHDSHLEQFFKPLLTDFNCDSN